MIWTSRVGSVCIPAGLLLSLSACGGSETPTAPVVEPPTDDVAAAAPVVPAPVKTAPVPTPLDDGKEGRPERHADVVSLFLDLPASELDPLFGKGSLKEREAVLARTERGVREAMFQPYTTLLDRRNGYLGFHQPGDGDSTQLAYVYFKLGDGSQLLAVESTSGPMCGEVSSVKLYRYAGAWTDETAVRWPTLGWSVFGPDAEGFDGQPEWVVSLPRRGRDVTVKLSECTDAVAYEKLEPLLKRELKLQLVEDLFQRVDGS
ncbi:MAG: hypothetical protein KC912_25975 [Proteobacteria bacterium]|nr:hypothetical protein [Pseudomonadota bacterium]